MSWCDISRPTSRTGSDSGACGKSSRITSCTRSITCGEELGLAGARALEHPARLGVDVAEAHGDVAVARIEAPHQLGVADGGGDRVRVRVAMTRDVDDGKGVDAGNVFDSERPGRPWPGRGRR